MEQKLDQQTLSHILSVTEQLIKETGCQQTTLQMIMDRTGLSKGAIYHYVKSKDELFGKILESYMTTVNHQFHEAVKLSQDNDIRPAIQAIVSSMAERGTSNTIFIYLLSQQHKPNIATMLKELRRSLMELSEAWITIGKEHGAIPAHVDVKAFASMFVTLSYGLRVNQMIADDQLVPQMQDVFLFMINAFQK
ncbi:TetR/AcrR family transcriptional regulator [Paenibacillus sp. WQ 127069]|uniref:TetR/AcrR family transcriptional regulator n=1 Tax=Paenibacillus baimaensis TaxID=2982185 RepID=A0ABT2UQT5_9BACL|nr:TetR/AcrR family transcriptional regulator [Paenibacillus sp. WQ 127069]MCU6796401.1 TetR/AcrR family transcriptional regulator [Paenibacillus sp. WQ 127069]